MTLKNLKTLNFPKKLHSKHILLLALFAFFLAALPSTAGASALPESIKTELIQSQMLLQKQEQLILAQQQELQNLKSYVTALEATLLKAENKLALSAQELEALREDLKKSSASIESANNELQMLSQDMKKKTSTLKAQRNLAIGIGGIFAVLAATR